MISMNVFKLLYRTITLKFSNVDSDHTSDYNIAAATYDDYYTRHLGKSSQAFFDMLPITSGMKMLDLACGTGFFTHRIARKIGGDGHLTAVDLSPEMLAQNRKNAFVEGLTNIEFVEADAIKVFDSQPDNSLDGVVCGWGICYMDHAQLRQKLERVVRPGGFIGIIENRANTLKAVSDLFRKVMIECPDALIKNMAISLPKDHCYLLKAFCKGSFQQVKAWDGKLSVPCRNGSDIVEYMLKSGASAGFINAIDKKMVDEVMQRLVKAADKCFQKQGNVPVVHEYCALLAINEKQAGSVTSKYLQ